MIWNLQLLMRIDWRLVIVVISLSLMSLMVLSSQSPNFLLDGVEENFFTPLVKNQLQWFFLGWVCFFFFAAFDYNKLREWTWILYFLMIVSLLGLYFTNSIQRVHRWYRIPFVNLNIQPSEYAKLIVVMSLSWYLERQKKFAASFKTLFFAMLIVGIPFILILRQPDLGTALVLLPMSGAIFYFGDIHPIAMRLFLWIGGGAFLLIAMLFLNVIPFEGIKPYALKVIKDYQVERLNPETPHQKAASTAIAVGGFYGTGWQNSTFTKGGWLPAPYTDSVFPAFSEEFGLIGIIILVALFYALLYFSFQVTAVAKDDFGRMLSAGITVYLGVHILINMGMMSGFFPITGVPLILISYGGSSILATYSALGILQSIYSRRFMF